jgi:hypothetical protein
MSLPIIVTAADSGTPALEAEAAFELTINANPKPWQNPQNPFDVDADGDVVPLDALKVINYLNAVGIGPLPYPTAAFSPPNYYDINGDNNVEPLDVLQLINYLNQNESPAAEGESASPASAGNTALVSDHPGTSEPACRLRPDTASAATYSLHVDSVQPKPLTQQRRKDTIDRVFTTDEFATAHELDHDLLELLAVRI